VRRHIEGCEGCRAFAAEVRRQRAGLRVLVSVVPSRALKHRILTGASAAAGSDGSAAGAQSVPMRVLLLALVVAGAAALWALRRRAVRT